MNETVSDLGQHRAILVSTSNGGSFAGGHKGPPAAAIAGEKVPPSLYDDERPFRLLDHGTDD